MYDILSLINSTLFNCSHDSLMSEKKPVLNSDSHSLFHRKMHICLLVRCHLFPIWPPVLPLNLTYILIFLLQMWWVNLPYTDFLQTRLFIQRIRPGLRPFVTFRNKLIFLRWGVTPRSTPKWRPTLVGCPWLLIQYIRSYSPYLEVIFSIRNLRTRHAMVTKDPPNMAGEYKRHNYTQNINNIL
jgi:hypothetical protein